MQLPNLLITLAWSVILSHVPITLWAQDLPALGTQAVNLDSQPIATETTFTGGFSVDSTIFQSDGTIAAQQPITIKGIITVDPKQVGQTADLIVYVNYGLLDLPLTPETSTSLMVGENTTILPWNIAQGGKHIQPLFAGNYPPWSCQQSIYIPIRVEKMIN